jgi:hypothetical protein
MDGFPGGRPGGASWSIDEIPFTDLDRDEVHGDRQLFYMLASASFVEITSNLYTSNLVAFYRGDDELTDWLSRQWEAEEMQHGAALKRYVKTAWPEFDWEAGYRDFFEEYRHCCAIDLLADTQALEMAARCVVETGTSTFYRALSDMTDEPVLKRLTANISSDEVRHYKNFYHAYLRYHEREGNGRLAILRTLWQRVSEVDNEDAFLAFKHVFLTSNPGAAFKPDEYEAFRAATRQLAKRYYPHDMAIRMMLKPLDLRPTVTRMIVPPMVSAAKLLFLR